MFRQIKFWEKLKVRYGPYHQSAMCAHVSSGVLFLILYIYAFDSPTYTVKTLIRSNCDLQRFYFPLKEHQISKFEN